MLRLFSSMSDTFVIAFCVLVALATAALVVKAVGGFSAPPQAVEKPAPSGPVWVRIGN